VYGAGGNTTGRAGILAINENVPHSGVHAENIALPQLRKLYRCLSIRCTAHFIELLLSHRRRKIPRPIIFQLTMTSFRGLMPRPATACGSSV